MTTPPNWIVFSSIEARLIRGGEELAIGNIVVDPLCKGRRVK